MEVELALVLEPSTDASRGCAIQRDQNLDKTMRDEVINRSKIR